MMNRTAQWSGAGGVRYDVVAASVGSACHSAHDAVSGVLAAMGVDATRVARQKPQTW